MLVTDLLVESLPRRPRRRVHRRHGGRARPDRGGPRALGGGDAALLRPFEGPRARRGRDARREARGASRPTSRARSAASRWSSSGGGAASSSPAAATPSARTPPNFKRDEDGTIGPSRPRSPTEVCDEVRQADAGPRSAASASSSAAPAIRTARTSSRSSSPIPSGSPARTCGMGDLYERRSKRGNVFFSCNRYPDCTFAAWDRP